MLNLNKRVNKLLEKTTSLECKNVCKEVLETAGAEWNDSVSVLVDNHIVSGSGISVNAEFVEKMISLFCGLESEDEPMQDAA